MERQMTTSDRTTVDKDEVDHFTAMAAEWWDPAGKFRPLHKFNPVRVEYIKRQVCAHFDREFSDPQALKGLRILDIGCGGGLLAEPMARMGAEVVGADPSQTNIEVASIHARTTTLTNSKLKIRVSI
jgi:2-polyprenyl-6-hydroxyphenyl methylase/3-demethylubiquinone-9 3-methyltransferase